MKVITVKVSDELFWGIAVIFAMIAGLVLGGGEGDGY